MVYLCCPPSGKEIPAALSSYHVSLMSWAAVGDHFVTSYSFDTVPLVGSIRLIWKPRVKPENG
jgi:hypothetical protein